MKQFDSKLIEAVKSRHEIYDTSLPANKDKLAKEHLWKEISASLGKPVAACMDRWGRLREKYRMYTVREINESNANRKCKWIHYEDMMFLRPFLKKFKQIAFETKKLDEDSAKRSSSRKEDIRRCGEIFISKLECFSFVCTECGQHFKAASLFFQHVKDDHLNEQNVKDKCLNNEPEEVEDSERVEKIKTEVDDDPLDAIHVTCNDELVEIPDVSKLTEIKEEMQTGREDETSTSQPEIPDVPTAQCVFCAKVLAIHSMPGHMKGHRNKYNFQCKICDKKFSNKTSFNDHQVVHTGERKFNCDLCDKKFRFRTSLTAHTKRHNKDKRFKCDFCEKAFVGKYDRDVHTLTHTGEKPHICEICGTGFTTQSYLKLHIRRHLNIRNYKCKVCEKSFHTKEELAMHDNSHTDNRPYACELCPAKFRRRYALRQHLLIHSGEKNFVCKICSKAFTQHTGLYCHMKSHGIRMGQTN